MLLKAFFLIITNIAVTCIQAILQVRYYNLYQGLKDFEPTKCGYL